MPGGAQAAGGYDWLGRVGEGARYRAPPTCYRIGTPSPLTLTAPAPQRQGRKQQPRAQQGLPRWGSANAGVAQPQGRSADATGVPAGAGSRPLPAEDASDVPTGAPLLSAAAKGLARSAFRGMRAGPCEAAGGPRMDGSLTAEQRATATGGRLLAVTVSGPVQGAEGAKKASKKAGGAAAAARSRPLPPRRKVGQAK